MPEQKMPGYGKCQNHATENARIGKWQNIKYQNCKNNKILCRLVNIEQAKKKNSTSYLVFLSDWTLF